MPWLDLGLSAEWVAGFESETKENGLPETEKKKREAFFEDIRVQLQCNGACVCTRIAQGKPANELLREAERGRYDLVVLGASGDRARTHGGLGSVSTKVASSATCSVLIAGRETPVSTPS
jgi:nucleotide-binding universal stress UspA family protein